MSGDGELEPGGSSWCGFGWAKGWREEGEDQSAGGGDQGRRRRPFPFDAGTVALRVWKGQVQ